MKRFYKKNKQETYLILTIILIALLIGIKNPVFFTASNLAGIIRNLIIDGMMAYAIMLGIIIGGIDVSFPAIAVCSMYITNRFAQSVDYSGPVILLFMMSMGIGLALGLINGFLITRFKLPAFVVTLGTSSAFYGLLISVLGGSQVNRLVDPLEKVSKFRLWVVTSGASQTIIPITFIFMLVIMLLTWFILNKTMLGRMIYAIGGDRIAAERVGFPVNKIIISLFSGIHNGRVTILTFVISGMLSAVAGIIVCSRAMSAKADYGSSYILQCLLVAILGGISPFGGKGKVVGIVLSIITLQILSSGFNILRFSSYQKTFIWGFVLILVMIINYLADHKK